MIFPAVHTSIAGIGLDIIDFPAKAAPGTVDPEIVANFGILFGVVPACAGLLAACFFLRIGITRQSHAKTMAELAILRQKRGLVVAN